MRRPARPCADACDIERSLFVRVALPALVALSLAALLAAGCTPTVKVEAPKEPITINLNVKLDAEVRVKLEEQAREDIEENPDIF